MAERETEGGLAFERLVFFSDAVFAIAITLLVLEIQAPHLGADSSDRDLLAALLGLLPKLIGFAVSFAVIGSMWIEHHRIFRYIARYDDGLLWRNLFFLLVIAFMPFPTALYSENHRVGAALALYAGSLAVAGLAKLWIWRYAAAGGRLLAADVAPSDVRRVGRRSWAVPLTCFGIAALGGAGVSSAYLGFPLIPLAAWLLDRPKGAARKATRGGA